MLRSGEFASLRRRSSGHELAFLAHPRRSIQADRAAPDRPWEYEDAAIRTPDQARHRALRRINEFDAAGRRSVALVALTDDIARLDLVDHLVVTALDRFTEADRPRVRVRIEDHSPADRRRYWRAVTYVLAADDLYAVQSERAEVVEPVNTTYRSSFTYDRHEGIPVLRSVQFSTDSPSGSRSTSELKVVERRFGPIPESEFAPESFLDGLKPNGISREQVKEPSTATILDWYWLALGGGGISLAGGSGLALGSRDRRALRAD